jgi:hypothetical protein
VIKIFGQSKRFASIRSNAEISNMSQQVSLEYEIIPEKKAGIGGQKSPIPGVFCKIGGDAPLLLYDIC